MVDSSVYGSPTDIFCFATGESTDCATQGSDNHQLKLNVCAYCASQQNCYFVSQPQLHIFIVFFRRGSFDFKLSTVSKHN
jgi:hypothetical protein